MRIAICDDEEAQCRLLSRYCAEWGQAEHVPVHTQPFASAEAFLFHYAEDKTFDLLILDIQMGRMDGLALASRLRAGGDAIPILFVTGYEQYMASGFEVEAMHYLIKPLQKEKLFAVLSRAAKANPPEEKHLFRGSDGVLSLPLSAVWYLEARGHNSVLHTADREYLLYEGISALAERLAGECGLCLCHRSILVNLRHAACLEKNELVLDDGTRLPVSRSMKEKVARAFIQTYKS